MFDYLSTLFSEPLAFFDQAIFRTLAVLIGLCATNGGMLMSLIAAATIRPSAPGG